MRSSSALELFEEGFVYFVSSYGFEAQFQSLQHIHKFLPIYKLDCCNAVAGRFPLRLSSESACCNDNAFVCAARHRATKIAHM